MRKNVGLFFSRVTIGQIDPYVNGTNWKFAIFEILKKREREREIQQKCQFLEYFKTYGIIEIFLPENTCCEGQKNMKLTLNEILGGRS